MSLNNFFQFFVPKEKKFYPLYQKQADYIMKASQLLRKMITTSSATSTASYSALCSPPSTVRTCTSSPR